MTRAPEAATGTCVVCRRVLPSRDLHPWVAVRPGIGELIARDHPGWVEGAAICREDLAAYRRRHVERLLEEERGELGALEQRVLASIGTDDIIAQPADAAARDRLIFGERMADRVAAFGGSWTFILGFLTVLVLWMLLNITGWLFRPFDRYPFILLNLALSCVAALQAPIIMMSQRRQEEKDRLRAENDYQVNLKAELEIRQLHEKLDHQLAGQWAKLTELQRIQIDLLEEREGQR